MTRRVHRRSFGDFVVQFDFLRGTSRKRRSEINFDGLAVEQASALALCRGRNFELSVCVEMT